MQNKKNFQIDTILHLSFMLILNNPHDNAIKYVHIQFNELFNLYIIKYVMFVDST